MATNHITYTYPSLIAATAGLGVALAVLTATAPQTVDQPPPVPATVDLQEDEAGWDCNIHGNGSCDPVSSAAAAWQAWDASRNALELGTQTTRIEYVGPSDVPVPGHMWVDGYLFRIIYPTI